MENNKNIVWITRYKYDNPHGAGPFRGKMETPRQYAKGESIYAAFGHATTVSRSSKKKGIAS